MSLRKRLRARPRPHLVYELPTGDVGSATRALAEAEEAYDLVALGADDGEDAAARTEAKETAWRAVEQAKADLAACYERIEITAMLPDDYEALIAKHPPRPDTDDKTWNGATFPQAAFLACVEGGDLDPAGEAEWLAILRENVSLAEREDLYVMARIVNTRLVNPAVPKGSTPTRNS
ncbi:hypothetical protein [Herbidospora sp. RD11066]